MKRTGRQEKSNTFVVTLDVALSSKMVADLKNQGFTISKPPYTLFSAKKKGISCTFYESGKLTVQGKDKDPFIEFYLEPEIIQEFSYNYKNLNINTEPRIGIDESGKGDFFGPLCIAGVFAEGDAVSELRNLGVRDSKLIKDHEISEIAKMIKENYAYHIVKINPLKYNELYQKFGNLNHLLAWGHATAIEHLVSKTHCNEIIIDQFAAESVVETALNRKKINVSLTQRHRGEEDLVVAAASILARQTFVEGLALLGEEYVCCFPKGASQDVIKFGKEFVKKYGEDGLRHVAKTHFKTLDAILGKTTQSSLPLRKPFANRNE